MCQWGEWEDSGYLRCEQDNEDVSHVISCRAKSTEEEWVSVISNLTAELEKSSTICTFPKQLSWECKPGETKRVSPYTPLTTLLAWETQAFMWWDQFVFGRMAMEW